MYVKLPNDEVINVMQVVSMQSGKLKSKKKETWYLTIVTADGAARTIKYQSEQALKDEMGRFL